MKQKLVPTLALCLFTHLVDAQVITLEQALKRALVQNRRIQAAGLQVKQQQAAAKAAWELPKTEINLLYGRYNSVNNDNNITIRQTLPFPITWVRQVQLAQSVLRQSECLKALADQEIATQVKSVYHTLLYLKALLSVRTQADSLLGELARASAIRYRTGEATLMEKTSAENRHRETQLQLLQSRTEYALQLRRLGELINEAVTDISGNLQELPLRITDSLTFAANPMWQNQNHLTITAHAATRLEKSKLWPELRLGYFNQTLIGTQTIIGNDVYFGAGTRFEGVEAGISVPLWFLPARHRIHVFRFSEKAAEALLQQTEAELMSRWQQLWQQLQTEKNILAYYRTQGLPSADLLIAQTQKAFQAGEISYTEALLNARQALQIREDFLACVNRWNQLIIEAEFLSGMAYENIP